MVHEHGGGAFEHLIQAAVLEDEAHHDVVDGQQREGAEDAAGDGVVVADDGVLDGVGEGEEHDQVEGFNWASSRLPKMRSRTTRTR